MATLFYYNGQGSKIEVTVAELQSYAMLGLITPGTIIENKMGLQLQAGQVKGLTFGETPPSQPSPKATPNIQEPSVVVNSSATDWKRKREVEREWIDRRKAGEGFIAFAGMIFCLTLAFYMGSFELGFDRREIIVPVLMVSAGLMGAVLLSLMVLSLSMPAELRETRKHEMGNLMAHVFVTMATAGCMSPFILMLIVFLAAFVGSLVP